MISRLTANEWRKLQSGSPKENSTLSALVCDIIQCSPISQGLSEFVTEQQKFVQKTYVSCQLPGMYLIDDL